MRPMRPVHVKEMKNTINKIKPDGQIRSQTTAPLHGYLFMFVVNTHQKHVKERRVYVTTSTYLYIGTYQLPRHQTINYLMDYLR